MLFNYGRRAGVMSVILVVLAIVPALVALSFWPGLPERVAMKVSAAGEVERWGTKFELLVVPALCFAFSLAAYANAGKQAREHAGESEGVVRSVCERYLRNGLVIAVVLNLANVYVYYMAITGHGLGF